jgi:hypothetical protein
MARGKDLKRRKTDGYSSSIKVRFENNEYRKNLKKSIIESRKNEHDIPCNIGILTYEDTRIKILELGEWSQGTNRKIFKNKELYASILFYTSKIKFYSDKIAEKVYFIIHNRPTRCTACSNSFNFISFNIGYSGCNTKGCVNVKPKGYVAIKKRLGSSEYEKMLSQKIKTFTADWFKQKYGDDWEKYHKEYKEKMKNVAISNLQNFKAKSSKAANAFFTELNELGFNGRYAQSDNGEMHILVKNNEIDKNIIFLDYVFNNKIIEYDGSYFHDAQSDIKRDIYLNNLGYSVLRVSHKLCMYKETRKSELNKCINFLNEED